MKKRTIDEHTAETTEPTTSAAATATDPLNQTNKIKKKKKLKAKRISKTQSSLGKMDTTAELVAKNLLDQSLKSEKLSLLVTNNATHLTDTVKKQNPNKKVRLTQDSSMSVSVGVGGKKTKVKAKKSKKKSSVMGKKSSTQSVTTTSTTTTTSSVFAEFQTSTQFEFNNQADTKTPLKTTHSKQINSIMESNSKTIKAEKRIPSIHASGKVKQMVEMVEARMKTSMQNTPNTTIKQTNSVSTHSKMPQYSQSIQDKKVFILRFYLFYQVIVIKSKLKN